GGRIPVRADESSTTLELMERRQMLSAAVSHGVLVIEGSPRADTIVLTSSSRKNVLVRMNGGPAVSFQKKTFGRIRILAGRGDDLVTVGSDAAPIVVPVKVLAAAGADTVVAGMGNDTIRGGAG